MLSNSGDCDMQARSYNDATAPVNLRKKKQIREEGKYRSRNNSSISRVGSSCRTGVVLDANTKHKGCKRASRY